MTQYTTIINEDYGDSEFLVAKLPEVAKTDDPINKAIYDWKAKKHKDILFEPNKSDNNGYVVLTTINDEEREILGVTNDPESGKKFITYFAIPSRTLSIVRRLTKLGLALTWSNRTSMTYQEPVYVTRVVYDKEDGTFRWGDYSYAQNPIDGSPDNIVRMAQRSSNYTGYRMDQDYVLSCLNEAKSTGICYLQFTNHSLSSRIGYTLSLFDDRQKELFPLISV